MQLMQAAMSGASPGTSGFQGGASAMQSLMNKQGNEALMQQLRGAKKWLLKEYWEGICIYLIEWINFTFSTVVMYIYRYLYVSHI